MSTPNPEHSARVQWIPLGLLASWRSISLRWNAQTAKRRLGSPLVRSLVVQTVCRSGPEEVTVAPADSGDYELSYPFLCSVSVWNWMFWGHSFALQYWWKCSKTGLGLERREKKKKKNKTKQQTKKNGKANPPQPILAFTMWVWSVCPEHGANTRARSSAPLSPAAAVGQAVPAGSFFCFCYGLNLVESLA